MANLSGEEGILSKNLEQFWSTAYRKPGKEKSVPHRIENELLGSPWAELDLASQSPPEEAKEYDFGSDYSGQETTCHDEYIDAVHTSESLLDQFTTRLGDICIVDGLDIGDVPAIYHVIGVREYELPVKGTFVHPAIIQGFSYVIRPVDSEKPLFDGNAMRLERIGMGYAKRLTFASPTLNHNDNYFWSDTNPEGYGFSLQAIAPLQMFTLFDANNLPTAEVEVEYVTGPQIEVKSGSEETGKEDCIEKYVEVSLMCRVHYFEESFISHSTSHSALHIQGLAKLVKQRTGKSVAKVEKVENCIIEGEKGYVLVPLQESDGRHRIVSGAVIGDIPTKYYISGLFNHELPVIGTYVDPRITPGYCYKVRPSDSRKCYFEGKALKLLSVGKGYGKRITFDSGSLNINENYFYSDTNSEGFGLTIHVVNKGDYFRIENNAGVEVGCAEVYRADEPQSEISTCVLPNGSIEKRVRVSLKCHLSVYGELDITTNVTGLAIVEKQKRKESQVLRIESIALSSQINILLTHLNDEIVFVR